MHSRILPNRCSPSISGMVYEPCIQHASAGLLMNTAVVFNHDSRSFAKNFFVPLFVVKNFLFFF